MYPLFVILIVIAALLMIFIVLIQESKGGGLTSNFQDANKLVGVRKTTNFIEKATWGLAIAMVVLSVLCAAVAPRSHGEESAVENQTENPLTNPATQQKQARSSRCRRCQARSSRSRGCRSRSSRQARSSRSCTVRKSTTSQHSIVDRHSPRGHLSTTFCALGQK